MVTNAAQKLAKDGAALGKVQNGVFTPKVYSDKEDSRFESFLSTNQYMTFQMAKSCGVNLKEWVKERSIEGLHLSSVFVKTELVEPLLQDLNDSFAASGWVDMRVLLPPVCVEDDARELQRQLASQKRLPADSLSFEKALVGKNFIKSIATSDALAGEITAAATRLLTAPAAKGSAKKGASAAVDDDEDIGGSKKKGKKAATKGKKGKAGVDDDAAEVVSAASGIDNTVIIDLLSDAYPELPLDLHEELCSLVQEQLVVLVEAAQETLRSSMQSAKKVEFEKTEKLVQEQYERLSFGRKSLEALKLVDSPLHAYLMRETVADPLHRLLALRWEEVTGSVMEVNANSRKQCLDKLIAKEGAAKLESLTKLLQASFAKAAKEEKASKESTKAAAAAAQEDGVSIVELFHAAADDCHIFCRKVDKKREKSICQERKAACKAKLGEIDPAEVQEVFVQSLLLALAVDGVPGLLFPAEPWALELVSKNLNDSELVEEALKVCEALEQKAETSEELSTAFKGRVLAKC
mmetsp:Transcript_38025/g.85623  ORF Transcript_38025/g.85623 Transcript_38025/m.85623 type:complete len:522 (+) Transcript_38025:3-1568(+)